MKKESQRFIILLILAMCFMLFMLLINISFGSVKIPLGEIWEILSHPAENGTNHTIFWEIRFPRAVAAFILGGALGLSGYLLQVFFHNPIAGPFVLGISSGAKLAVALLLIYATSLGVQISAIGLIGISFLGALIAMGIVLIYTAKIRNMGSLIIAGVMIGYICTAITDVFVTFAEDRNIVNLHNWSQGSFSGTNWSHVKVEVLVVSLLFMLTIFLSKSILAFQMGEEFAKKLGVSVKALQIGLVIISSFLAATVVAFAGPVSFVGVAVPHMVQPALKSRKPLYMIPLTFLYGGIFCLFCDFIARMIFAPTELAISTVTAFFGAPVVLYVLVQRKKER